MWAQAPAWSVLLLNYLTKNNLVPRNEAEQVVKCATRAYIVGEHESTGFDYELEGLLVAYDCSSETGSGAGLPTSVDGAR